MAKTVSLPPVRVEPAMRDALAEIAEETGFSIYELTRQSVAYYIYIYQVSRREFLAMADDKKAPA